jgi:hypothetical protein
MSAASYLLMAALLGMAPVKAGESAGAPLDLPPISERDMQAGRRLRVAGNVTASTGVALPIGTALAWSIHDAQTPPAPNPHFNPAPLVTIGASLALAPVLTNGGAALARGGLRREGRRPNAAGLWLSGGGLGLLAAGGLVYAGPSWRSAEPLALVGFGVTLVGSGVQALINLDARQNEPADRQSEPGTRRTSSSDARREARTPFLLKADR